MDEDQIFINEAIRDTVNHDSSESNSGVMKAKTLFIQNSLNQIVTLQLQGARNATWVNVGINFNVSANTNTYKTVSDYFPKFRIQAFCSTAPTTGGLDLWIIKVL